MEALVRTLWASRDKSPTQNIAKNKGMTLASLQEKGRMLGTAGHESSSGIVKCLNVPLSFTFLWASAPSHPTATSLSCHDAETDEQASPNARLTLFLFGQSKRKGCSIHHK